MKRLKIVALLSIALTGCTSNLGSLVTDVRTDGKGALVIQRAQLILDQWNGSVSIRNQTIEVLRMENVEAKKP